MLTLNPRSRQRKFRKNANVHVYENITYSNKNGVRFGRPPNKRYTISMAGRIIHGKRCSRCRTIKPFEQYHRNKRSTDGLNHICRECKRIENARRRQSDG